eukprot:5106971-Prorocentrum_lima.AAC.1
MALSIQLGGGSLLAIVCSTWVRVNRGTSGRSRTIPLGRKWLPQVARANRMASRTALLLQALEAMGASWLLEQPR